ncbi:MAG TPA: hypothetical protein VNT31_12790 [Nocardioides sp.]|nr:hypothetical protein [Nocardioides sp.]
MAHDTHHGLRPWRRHHHDSDDHVDRGHRDEHDDHVDRGHHLTHRDRETLGEQHAHDEFGGVNMGAAFFGWLVAIAMAVLLTSIAGAIAAAVGETTDFTQSDAEREAGAVSLGVAIAFVAIMALAYFAGGYVAGRMSRFDGARQGVAVWVLGLVLTVAAGALGWLFGSEYNLLDRVDLPRFPLPTDTATTGGLIALAVLLVATFAAAAAGGLAGHRYHDRVDRIAHP